MSWTDERIVAVLSNLDTADADETFWDRVHTDLLTSQPELNSTSRHELPADQPLTQVREFAPRRRRGRGVLVVAAAATVVVTGLYVIGRGTERQAATSPIGDVVLTDPLSLSLDDLPRTASAPTQQLDYLVPDFAQLPPGWTAALTAAYGLIWPPSDGYRTLSSLVGPTGESFNVHVITGFSLKPQGGSQIDINGHAGTQTANELWWEQEPGVEVMVTRAPTSAGEGVDVADAARGLVFATVHELPTVTIDPATVPPRLGAQFAGTLNGVHYNAFANTGPLRGIRVSVGDQGSIGGVDNDRLSQPTDDPETTGGVNIAGVPGYGIIAFGYTEPAAAALRATLADGSTVQVPVLRNPGETYFAIPIPLGVEVTTLDFLDDAGASLRSAVMPSLPAYFGGCCASAPWSTDLEAASPSPTTNTDERPATTTLSGLGPEPAESVVPTDSPSQVTGDRIGDPIDPTRRPVDPHPEWVSVGRDDIVIGYIRDPALPTLQPDEIDTNSHPELLIYNDEGAIIGTFFQTLPVLWSDTTIAQPDATFELVTRCDKRSVELDNQWWEEETPAEDAAASKLGSGIVRYINATTAMFVGDDRTIAGFGRLAMILHPVDNSTDLSNCL